MSLAERVLYIGATTLEWVVAEKGQVFPQVHQLSLPDLDHHTQEWLAALKAGLQGELSQTGPKRVRIVLGGALVASLTLPWSRMLLDQAKAAGLCRLRYAAQRDDVAAAAIQWVQEADVFGRNRLALGIDTALLAVLQQAATQAGCELVSIQSAAVTAWQALSQQHRAGFALVENDSFTLLRADQHGALTVVGVRRWQGDWSAPLALLWRRTLLRDATAAATEDKLHVLHVGETGELGPDSGIELVALPAQGNAPRSLAAQFAAWPLTASLNFAPARSVRRHGTGAVALALGCAVLAASVWWLWSASNQLAATQALQSVRSSAPRPVKTAAMSEPEARALTAQVRAVNQLVDQLNWPLDQLMHTVEPPAGTKVALLGIELAGQNERVKLLAAAQSLPEMTKYLAYLAKQNQLSGVYLLQHDVTTDNPSAPIRFSLEAEWHS
ncbi:hypothetical protein [Andreprevotia chitinilytica]|uniref:hypothetical protein n=1 Tax=Andreprevotia chitinilytica TaxID=396808 RepID=UPI00054F00F8|nr:hypothetical protein [Andreprevotia chitinilytica]